jgi:hypothetical protein
MTEKKRGDYEVGYGKPPKSGQFVAGQSGFRGRTKRKAETQSQIVARLRDELITVGGQKMTRFELSVMSVINQTIKGGKPRDLKLMLELLVKYGATPQVEAAIGSKAAADAVIGKLLNLFDRTQEMATLDVANSPSRDSL